MEAPNPFNQSQHLEANESLKFEGGFWDDESVKRNASAYDDDNTYQVINDNNNAYDDNDNNNNNNNNDKEQKTNAITSLFNNMKSKLNNDDQNGNNNNNNNNNNDGAYDGAYGDDSWINDEPTKPSKSEGVSSNLLSTNQVTMVCEYAV